MSFLDDVVFTLNYFTHSPLFYFSRGSQSSFEGRAVFFSFKPHQISHNICFVKVFGLGAK